MIRLCFVTILVIVLSCCLWSQVAITADGSDPDSSAMLDIRSSDKGVLISRLDDTERDAIASPAEGLLIYNTSSDRFEYFTGGAWKTVLSAVSGTSSTAEGSGFCSEGVKDINGHAYTTVKIGNKCWMAENLRSTTYSDSSAITGWYNYDDEVHHVLSFGRLYTWTAIMNGAPSSNQNPSGVQGICPVGWHLPSEKEWKFLEFTLGMSQAEYNTTGLRGSHGEGTKIMETADCLLWNGGLGGNNHSGFSALPAGALITEAGYAGMYSNGYFWTCTETATDSAWFRAVGNTSDQIMKDEGSKNYAFSVRCVRD